MGIKIKGGSGDLTGTSKKEKEARAKAFSAKQNATVKTRMQQSENGFKGESKNEYGLPNGNQQVQSHVGPEYTGPKDRKVNQKLDKVGADKYADGAKGIKIKPKTTMPSDATSVRKPVDRSSLVNKDRSDFTKGLANNSDDELYRKSGENLTLDGYNGKGRQALDSLNARRDKRFIGVPHSRFSKGSKGIKMKTKSC